MRRTDERSGFSSLAIASLLAFLPFEPRTGVSGLGFEVTGLEAVAAVASIAVLLVVHRCVLTVLRGPALPLLLLGVYAITHVVAAVLATEHREPSLKFAIRMLVMAGFGVLVATLPRKAHRAGLVAMACSAVVVACLAVAEGAGVRSIDPFLNAFREMPFNVGGARRATAGSEYPNQAAAFLMHGLVAWVGLAGAAWVSRRWLLPISVLLAFGLLFTYSRGALVAAALALAAMVGVAAFRREKLLVSSAGAVLGVLLASALAFAGGREVFRLRLGSEGTDAWYGAVYEPAETTLAMTPGEARNTPVRVTNAGVKTWSERDAFHLSYHWYDLERKTLADGDRTSLPADLPGGQSVLLTPLVVAPKEPGRYLLVWDMVHEDTTWFSGQGVRPATVAVTVGDESPVGATSTQQPPATSPGWRPGRSELWSLALRMWRENPWLGVGPDNFRRLYGRVAGQSYWDTRVFSNNTFLEAAATTGSFGALALIGVFVSAVATTLRRVWTASSSAERIHFATLLGLTIGLAAHGLVDYVLAFTGHYLWFGFVVGAVSARDEDRAASQPA